MVIIGFDVLEMKCNSSKLPTICLFESVNFKNRVLDKYKRNINQEVLNSS